MRRSRRILVVLVIVAGSTVMMGCENILSGENNAGSENNSGVGNGGSSDLLGGSDTIGRGYDFFSDYARPSEVKDSRILNLEALSGDDLVERRVIDEGATEVISGESVDEYLTAMSGDVTVEGGYKGFTGSVSASFSQESYQGFGRSFATVRSVVQKEKIFIDSSYTVNPEELKPYLEARFRDQINDPDISPAEIFQAYGTHVITSIFTGGRVEYNATARSSEIVTSRDFGAVARAGFDVKFLSVDADTAFSSSDEQRTFESYSDVTVNVYPAGQSSIDIATEQDYEEWQDAVGASEDNLLAAFDDDGLVGVWNFADDQSRRDELIAGFEEWGRTAEENLGLATFEESTFTVDFKAYGGWERVGGGDNEMDIDSPALGFGGDEVPVTAAVRFEVPQDNELVLLLDFEVVEDGGNGTHFRGRNRRISKTYTGPGTLVGINGNPSCSFRDEATGGDGRSGTFPADQCDLATTSIPGPLGPIEVGTIDWTADADGPNDHLVVGIGGTLNVPVVVRSSE